MILFFFLTFFVVKFYIQLLLLPAFVLVTAVTS